jgi:hypothetical protein
MLTNKELPTEVWPFFLSATESPIEKDRYYGFVNPTGINGEINGYTTLVEALEDISDHGPIECISSNPNDLGDATVCVLTGRQYIDRLEEIDPDSVIDYGQWSEKYCFTFCSNHSLRYNFVRVTAPDYMTARNIMRMNHQLMWGFQYNEEGFDLLIMTEVPLGTPNRYLEE